MTTVINLGTLGSEGFIAVGGSAELAGWSVSEAGDVNGDGYSDVIIGAPLNDDGGDDAGKAYVIFGGPVGFADIDLDNLEPSEGFGIQGANVADLAGFSVSGGGDINGDGFDDVIVGATRYGWYGSIATAYVVFGSASPTEIDLSNLSSSDGFVMQGEYNYYTYGTISVAGGGDINGDGFDDIIVGAMYDNFTPGQLGYGFTNGAAYVVFGKATGFGTIDLTNLSGAGFEIKGGLGDYAGRSVSWAGDINGDGFDDLVVGVPYGSNGGTYAGEAYVIFGKASGFSTLDLGNLAAGAGFLIQGDQAEDNAGWSVAGAGDVNGDGLDDIIVGAPYGDNGGTHAGEAYVIFGKTGGFGNVDLTSLSASAGFIIQGDDTGDHAGWSVAAAGDVNGDGYADIIVGAPHNDQTRNGAPRLIDAGEAYVIFGKANGFGTIDLTNLAPADGFIIQGEAENDLAGFSVSGAGDIDGDGFDDLVVSSPQNSTGGAGAGAVYIISGQSKFGDAANDFNGDGHSDILWRNDVSGDVTNWLGQVGGAFSGNTEFAYNNASLVWDIVGTGDFNGDGRDDILWRDDNGRVTNWLGNANGGFSGNIANAESHAENSWQVAGVGDFNGDGRDDVLWRNTQSGDVTNWLGQLNGSFIGNTQFAYNNASSAWQIVGVGDFNGDGRDDILWRSSDGTITNWLGNANGGFNGNIANAENHVDAVWQVAGIGDFNGDGKDDVLWRNTQSGDVTNWLGQTNGGFAGNTEFAYNNASLFWHVVGVGDYDGDGRDDILWRNDNGRVTNWLGNANGGFTGNIANAENHADNTWHVYPQDYVLV